MSTIDIIRSDQQKVLMTEVVIRNRKIVMTVKVTCVRFYS